MILLQEELAKVVEAMRPIDISYGQAMLDYLASVHPSSDLDLMPFFMFGHRNEINRRLIKKEDDVTEKYTKYPLIALRMDFEEDVNNSDITYPSINIVILASTEKGLNAEERLTQVFKPVLAPLYDRFMLELRNTGIFSWDNDNGEKPPHTRIQRPYWGNGTLELNEKNIFNDPLDAIELTGLQLSLNEKLC